MSKPHKRSKYFYVRVSDKMFDTTKKHARESKTSVVEYIRDAVQIQIDCDIDMGYDIRESPE